MEVTLQTRRLTLRPPCAEDAGPIVRLLNNFRVAGNLSRVPYPYCEADAVGWLRAWRPDRPAGETGFILDLASVGTIGYCGFHPDAQGTVVGYWLGEPFWNRGFMSEALAEVLAWYFDATEAVAIASGVFHFNRASLAIQRKLGFTETGTSFRHCLARKQQVRHIDTELTRSNWARRRRANEPKVIAVS